jgi:uncharacterized membrane protein YdbT with pleckstrin-like domain
MNTPADETVLWRGTPSQWTNAGTYFFCVVLAAAILAGAHFAPTYQTYVLAALVVPAIWALCRWLATRSHVYELTSQRIKISEGILSRRQSELELYRVRDYTVIEPFFLRLVGVGNVVLVTADRTTPEVVLHAVPRAAQLKDTIRTHTERVRQQKGVRDLEIDPPTNA